MRCAVGTWVFLKIFYMYNTYTYFLDNIDTKTALDAMRDLVTHCNLYLRDKKPPNAFLLQDIGIYVTEVLKIFGTIVEKKELHMGFPISDDFTSNNVPVSQIGSKLK